MSGINQWAITATARLHCDARRCGAVWVSDPYTLGRGRQGMTATEACAPAFAAGWRVYASTRQQYTYCQQHGPKSPLLQVYPAEQDR